MKSVVARINAIKLKKNFSISENFIFDDNVIFLCPRYLNINNVPTRRNNNQQTRKVESVIALNEERISVDIAIKPKITR